MINSLIQSLFQKKAVFICCVLFTLLIILPTKGIAQKNARKNVRQPARWNAAVVKSESSDPEPVVDLGQIYAQKSRIKSKTGLEKEKNVEKNLTTLRKEKKQLEKMLKKLDRQKRRLRYKARLKKKRRCA
ncbi:MAG: hypothetical protein DWQ05_15165 [Calditrichaeota bacterium]|nr:MAG: hypothetical protein DWQ05_15165 [Calditrichota bacterium]